MNIGRGAGPRVGGCFQGSPVGESNQNHTASETAPQTKWQVSIIAMAQAEAGFCSSPHPCLLSDPPPTGGGYRAGDRKAESYSSESLQMREEHGVAGRK